MDISMPKLDGIYTCGVIRVQPWADHTKVIAITGMSADEINERGQFAHFDAILFKPVDFCKLSDLLEQYSR
jgi:CheY-like chemotaxis protein